MGYILPELYEQLAKQRQRSCPTTFIETGTFMGGIPHRIMEMNVGKKSADLLDCVFEKLYTIELGERICRVASQRYIDFEMYGSNISFDLMHGRNEDFFWAGHREYFDGRLELIQGDSATVLWHLLQNKIEPGTDICFWLDAHAGAMKYARGQDDVPLLRELDCIRQCSYGNHIIAIDDANLFGTIQYDKNGNQICDYTEISLSLIEKKLLEINPNFEISIISPYGMEMLVAF